MATTPDQASGPCPVSPCDWDLEGTLEEHLYCDHDEEQLSKALVRVALENDGLRAELDKVDHALTAAKVGGYQAAARDATDLLTGHGPDAEMIVRFLQQRGAELHESAAATEA
jgi:hypothetical protein